MNAQPAPQPVVVLNAETDAVRTRYFIASFNLFFVMATAGLMYFGVASGPGAESAPMNEDFNFIIISIRTLCVVGVVTAACAWLYSWVRLRQL